MIAPALTSQAMKAMRATSRHQRRRLIRLVFLLIASAGCLYLGAWILVWCSPQQHGNGPLSGYNSDRNKYPIDLRATLLKHGQLDHVDIALCTPYGSNRFQPAAASWRWRTLTADETEAVLAGLAESYRVFVDPGKTVSFAPPKACLSALTRKFGDVFVLAFRRRLFADAARVGRV